MPTDSMPRDVTFYTAAGSPAFDSSWEVMQQMTLRVKLLIPQLNTKMVAAGWRPLPASPELTGLTGLFRLVFWG
jgi:hypothetical protein